jgi:hypothetical protein
MIVPEFWAEGRAQHRTREKSVTIRRFGWSDTSLADAQAMADARASDALGRQLAGENVVRREPRLAYNGAEGVPIREEILERHGSAVITRNLYGARCLNVPDVLFADIDFGDGASALNHAVGTGLVIAVGLACLYWYDWKIAIAGVVITSLLAGFLTTLVLGGKKRMEARGEQRARTRIARFVESHPDWVLRIYRTPAGFRLLALQRLFDPNEPAVSEFFAAVGVDKVYARMCFNQQCFRARLTAKPWRIGIAQHLKPRPGVWPIGPEHLDGRRRWVSEYEGRAAGYAACRFIETLGRGSIHRDADRVRDLHDELSGATRNLPLA